jgi:nicotinamide mononucleotide transporter
MSTITLAGSLRESFFIPKREQGMVANLIQGTILGIVLTALSYGLGLHLGWIESLSLLEAFAVFTSYVCTFLCVMERRINYPIGAISTVAYCVLFAQSALFASVAINAFLSVYLLYGWYRWRSDDDTRPVTTMSWVGWLVTLVVAGTGYLAVVGLATWLGGALAWTDSLILVGTIMAQFMMDNKKIENWAVWALMNCFAIYTYFHAGLTLVGFQYIFFLANTAYGYIMWRKGRNKAVEPAQAPLVEYDEDGTPLWT